MTKLSIFFYRISTGWVALAGLILFLGFSMLTLPSQSAQVESYSKGLGGPDTSLIYSGERLVQMAEVYGEGGRAAFLNARWSFDLAFPFIFTFFFITSVSFLFKKGISDPSRLTIVNLIPLAGLIFDLAENTATSVVIASYPRIGTWGQLAAPIFTPVKWFFVGLSMLLVVIGVVKRIFKARKKD